MPVPSPDGEAPASTGILNPGVVDGITHGAGGLVTLHMHQTCEWDGSDHLLLLLQEKVFTYLAFVADGELARLVANQRPRWRVVLHCTSEPDARTHDLVRRAAAECARLGGTFVTQPSAAPSDAPAPTD
jgi:hypothetical protein